MKIRSVILAVIFLISGVFYYAITDENTTKSPTKIARVIDGDTFENDLGQKFRLKGINTPESSMFFHDEARDFLDNFVNRSVEVEGYGFDKYGRTLAQIFYNGQHVNEEILREGLGTLYYYEPDDYYKNLKDAEDFARLNEKGIWRKSRDAGCLYLIELSYAEKRGRCSNEEILKLRNDCDKDLELTIKDDATHIYKEKIPANQLWEKNFSCIWNDDGDSLYVWDNEGILLFHRYHRNS